MLYVEWRAGRWPDLRKNLEHFKELATIENLPEFVTEWDIEGIALHVSPCGARLGNGKKGPYFAYKFEADGVEFMLADRSEPRGNVPNVVIRVTGETCLLMGSEQALAFARDLVVKLGGVTVSDKLSRVDIALDMPGADIDDIQAAFNERRYICRAKSIGFRKSNGLTLSFGEPPLQLRIYDKLAEVLKKGNPLKVAAMIQRRWGDAIPTHATRVEFELRRDALKSRGIDSVDDYFAKRADLVHYLTHDWIRLTVAPVDRENKNQSRADLLPLWADVQAGFAEWAGAPSGQALAPLDLGRVDVQQLLKQIAGLAKTAARYRGHPNATPDELAAIALDAVKTCSSSGTPHASSRVSCCDQPLPP